MRRSSQCQASTAFQLPVITEKGVRNQPRRFFDEQIQPDHSAASTSSQTVTSTGRFSAWPRLTSSVMHVSRAAQAQVPSTSVWRHSSSIRLRAASSRQRAQHPSQPATGNSTRSSERIMRDPRSVSPATSGLFPEYRYVSGKRILARSSFLLRIELPLKVCQPDSTGRARAGVKRRDLDSRGPGRNRSLHLKRLFFRVEFQLLFVAGFVADPQTDSACSRAAIIHQFSTQLKCARSRSPEIQVKLKPVERDG